MLRPKRRRVKKKLHGVIPECPSLALVLCVIWNTFIGRAMLVLALRSGSVVNTERCVCVCVCVCVLALCSGSVVNTERYVCVCTGLVLL